MTQELTIVKQNQELLTPTKEDYKEMQVGEPTNMLEARALASYLAKSKLLPQSLRGDIATALTLIVACKQYGLPVTALNETQEINGKVGFWGRTKLGIVLRNPVCEYIMPVEVTDKKAVVVAKRKGWPKEVTVEYTIENAKTAGLTDKDSWKKHPADMLLWKAESRAMSRVFPDICQGMSVVEDADEQEKEQVEAVALPQELEIPKPKRTRKVKVTAEESFVAEDAILPSADELTTYEQPKDEPVILDASVKEEYEAKKAEEQIPSVVAADAPKRYVRFVKQVLLENGERYIVAKNPIVDSEDKWLIPTAGMASELKKLTGMKAYLFVMSGKVVNYEEYPEA